MSPSQHNKQIITGLIGRHLGRSRFGGVLTGLAAADGIQIHFTLCDTALIEQFQFDAQIAKLSDQGWSGVSVTHPFKSCADGLADLRIGYPKGLGASNLLVFRNDAILAHNTDYLGMCAAWQGRFGTMAPGRVAVAGAGGVARALVAALIKQGAEEILIWDKLPDLAGNLARDLSGPVTPIAFEHRHRAAGAADGLVNATALGMSEYPGTAFEAQDFGHASWAFDAVYTPHRTKFLKDAQAAGLDTMSGFDLFKHMALASYAIYAERRPGKAADAMFMDLVPER